MTGEKGTQNGTASTGSGGSVLGPVTKYAQSGPCSLFEGVAGDWVLSGGGVGERIYWVNLDVYGENGGAQGEGKGGGATVKGAKRSANAAAEGALCKRELGETVKKCEVEGRSG